MTIHRDKHGNPTRWTCEETPNVMQEWQSNHRREEENNIKQQKINRINNIKFYCTTGIVVLGMWLQQWLQ